MLYPYVSVLILILWTGYLLVCVYAHLLIGCLCHVNRVYTTFIGLVQRNYGV